MSDDFINSLEDTRQTVRFQPDQNRNAGLFERAGQRLAQQRESAATVRNALNINISPESYNVLMNGVESGVIDEDELFRLATSMNIADRYGLPLAHVRENLQAYTAGMGVNPNERNPQTLFEFVGNKLKIGTTTPRMGNLMYQYMNAESSGDNEYAQVLLAEIQRIEAQNAALEDAIPNGARTARDHAKRILGAGAETIGYSAYQLGHWLLGAAAGGPLLGTFTAFVSGAVVEAGQEYYALRRIGIDADIARPLSQMHGVISSGIEQLLERLLTLGAGGLANSIIGLKLGESLVGRLTSKAFNNLQQNGFIYNLATTMSSWALNIPQEFAEEFLQEGDAILFENIAIAMQQENWDAHIAEIRGGRADSELSDEDRELISELQQLKENLTQDNWRENLGRMWEAGLQGGTAAIALGLPGAVAQTGISTADVARTRRAAVLSESKEQFRRETEEFSIFRNLEPENRTVAQDRVWENMRGTREQEETRLAEELGGTAGLGEGYAEPSAPMVDPETGEEISGGNIPLGEIFHNRNGLIHTEIDKERGLYKFGDPRVDGKRNLYAHMEFTEDDDGTVHIKEFHVRNDLDTPEFRYELFDRFAESFAGQKIVMDVNTVRGAEIREDLIRRNPRGEESGLNYYYESDTQNLDGARYRNRVIDNFKKHFPQYNNTVHAVMTDFDEMLANIEGRSLEEHINEWYGGLDKRFTRNTNQDIDAAVMKGKKVQGGVTFENSARDAKAVIYLSKNADLTTYIHEVGHIIRRRLSGDMLAQIEKIYGVKDGNWKGKTTNAEGKETIYEELFAEDLERYMRDGYAPSPEVKSLFEKIAEFLANIFNHIKEREAVSPEIKEFFDNYFARKQSEKASGDARAAQETSQETQTVNDTAEGTEGATGYDNIDAWVKTLPEENRRLYRENKALNDSRDSLGRKNYELQIEGVEAEDLEGLKTKAKEGHDFIRDLANKWANKWDDKAKGRPRGVMLKSDERAIEKHVEEETPYNKMFDMVGFTVVVKDFKTLLEMAEEAVTDEAVVRVKDRYKEITKSGYRDILLNIKAPNGFVGEIQLNIEQMYEAKGTYGGHALYEADRGLEKALKDKPETRDRDQKLLREMSGKFYGKAVGLVYAEAIASASSLDIADPSFHVYTSANSVGDKVLSAFTLNNLEPLLAQAMSRHSTKSSSGSSIDGTSVAETRDTELSTGATEAETTDSLSNISLPSTNSIEHKTNSVKENSEKNSEENEKRTEKAEAKWNAAERTVGAEDQITKANGEVIKGHYELREAGSSTPSHDPDADFTQHPFFPVTANGKTMNAGRAGYTGGFAREVTEKIGSDYDQRGIGIITDTKGIDASGNGRDQARVIAARKGTDGKYIAYLKSRPEQWGFTQEDIARYKHPTLYFVIEAPAVYTPQYFDQFNLSGMKSISPLETAIKMSYLLNDNNYETVKEFSAVMGNYESINELYEDTQAATGIFQSLMKKGIVSENSYPDYVETVSIKGKQQERVTSAGKEFLESIMLGSVLNEDSIRSLAVAGDIRKRVVKGAALLVDNAALGEYCVIPEINQAVGIAVEIQTNKKKYKSISDYADQSEMELGQRISTDIEVELAGRLLEKTEYAFSDMMGGLNAVLQEEAKGQGEMFDGTSKDEILRRYLGVKARTDKIREANGKVIESDTATPHEKGQAAIENAGLARSEADGTMFQIIGERGATALDKAEEATFRLDNLTVARQMEEKGETKFKTKFATGWERGADGKWRYEIPDMEYSPNMDLKEGKQVNLEDIIQGFELFKAYPALRTYKVQMVDMPYGFGGAFNSSAKLIVINKVLREHKTERNSLIHETQHAIQEIEGFARGSNEKYWEERQNGPKPLGTRDAQIQEFHETHHGIFESLSDEAKAIYREYNQEAIIIKDMAAGQEKSEAYAELNNKTEEKLRSEGFDTEEFHNYISAIGWAEFYSKHNDKADPYDLYYRTAGEVEARNAVRRKDYIRHEQITTLFTKTEDVARKDQVFIESGLTLFQTASEGTQTLFQLEDELVEDAAQYESWMDFRDSVEPSETSNADNAWYRSFWNDARKIYPSEETLLQEDEEKTSRAQDKDDSFYKEADKKYLTEALKELYRIHNDQTLEPTKEESGAARKDYKRIERLKRRIDTELPNAGSIIGMAAQVRSGRDLSSTQYDRLKGWIRKNKRDYRSVLADIMGQEEYLEDLADTKDGEPAGRLADPRPEKQDTKARLKEIASIVKETDPSLAKEIEDGTVSYDDQRIAAFEAGVDAEYKEAKAALDEIEKETAKDYARLANDAQKRIVQTYEKMIKAREQMENTDERIRRMMDEEGKIAEPYLNRQRLEKASYEQALKMYNDLVNIHGRDTEVREAVARREARSAERVKQKDIMRRQRAVRALREIKKKLVKSITRKVSFENVAYEQAEMVLAIKRIFMEMSFSDINKWIGPDDRLVLREVWSQWHTDEEFREKLLEPLLKRKHGDVQAERLKKILDKKWKDLNVNDKRMLHRQLPKTNYVKELGLAAELREIKESIQLDIDEHFIDDKVQMVVGDNLKRRLKETLGDELYNRVQNKPFNEWSLVEAEELAKVIDSLHVEGKRARAAKKEAERVLAQRYRNEVIEALETVKKYEDSDDDTPEERERKKEKREKVLNKFATGKKNSLANNFFDANLRRFTTAMDGGRKGIFTNLLYWSENDAYNEEQRQIAARRLVIDKVMEDNNINLDELYKEVEIPGLEGSVLDIQTGKRINGKADIYRNNGKITVDDLLFIMRGFENKETREAIMHGNLSNAKERAMQADGNVAAIENFARIGHGRLMLVMRHAKDFFAKEENKKFMKLYEAIGSDYDSNGERLQKACIEMFNKPMFRVESYVPMNRYERDGSLNEYSILDDILGTTGAGMKWVSRGMMIKREKIRPAGQRPIELGLYKTWANSVTKTEHLLAYGPLVRKLNSVFKGFHASEVKMSLKDRWGKVALDRVGDTIAKFANPNPTLQRSAADNLIRELRGKTATAYLAWKTSGILKQLVQSPWPYLQEIPPHLYIPACFEIAAGAGKINDFIREKSAYMKNRDFDPMVKLIREAMEKNKNAVLSGLDKFNAVGMKGIEWADWVCVAPGWLAVYRSELANVAKEQEAKYQELLQKYQGSEYSDVLPTPESKVNRALSEVMDEAAQDYEAVARADDAVRRMQPSSRSTDMSPLFEGKNEVWNALLQFQAALNVIWQNIRYDLPLAIREKKVGTVLGMVTGYALAGICAGLLMDGRDDDDDEETVARRILFNSLTQFTDAVPVIGAEATELLERVVSGRYVYKGKHGIFPVIEKAFGGVGNLVSAIGEEDPEKQKRKFEKAAGSMAESFGIYFGAPVSGIKELGHTVGIGDGDGEFELYLQALMGQRKK